MQRASIPWNVNQVTKAFQNGSLVFDNAIQRGYVWDKKRASLLVDSVLRGFTIPPIYTIRTNEKVRTPKGMVSIYDCIDGKQRCTALSKFINNEFALEGLEPFTMPDGTEVDLNGKTFEELDEDFQDTFKSYGLSVNYFTDITDEEISEMMSRMNNGKPLTGVENARIKAKNLPAIISLASHTLLTENLSEAALKGYANEDIVVKTFLLTNGDSDLSSKNVRDAYEGYEFTDEETASVRDALDFMETVTEELQYAVERKDIKKSVVKTVLKKTNLISVLYAHIQKPDMNAETFAKAMGEFFRNDNYNRRKSQYDDACSNGTMRPTNVEARNDALANFLDEYEG